MRDLLQQLNRNRALSGHYLDVVIRRDEYFSGLLRSGACAQFSLQRATSRPLQRCSKFLNAFRLGK